VSKINIAYVAYTIVDDVLKALGHKFDCRQKMIETVFSGITGLFLKKNHAVSIKGFLLKIFLFILGYSIEKAYA